MSKKNPNNTNNFFNVQQAADFLGVNPGTIRRWAQSKTVQGLKVGVRGDWRFTKDALLEIAKENTGRENMPEERLYERDGMLQTISAESLVPYENTDSLAQVAIPHLDWTIVDKSEHFVQFYESDEFLLDSLSKFIGMGLREGDACIVVATLSHRKSLEERLKTYGIDITAALVQGLLIVIDAQETLSKFSVDGMFDKNLFFETVQGIMSQVSDKRRNLRVFGEMVAILWASGNKAGAIDLEKLWNDFQATHKFSLFCAYPMQGFGLEAYGAQFRDIGLTHSKVIPTESYTALINPDERFRAIALLQQKAESLEAEIEKRKQLERQKDEFLAAASHELKTPLTSVKAYTQVLKHKFQKSGDEVAVGHLTKMNAQLNKLSKLVSDLLDVTKIDAGKLQFHEEYFDLNALIEEIVEEMQMTSKQTIEKNLAEAPNVFGDRDRVGQVLTNLLSNAIKYSPQGKKIMVKSSYEKDIIRVSVQDFGLGINPHDQAKVFDRYFRSSENETYPGMGLGLHIASEIVTRHNGHIWVESTAGKGSTFYFSLPLNRKSY